MQPSLTPTEFESLAERYPVVPLAVEILADRETAVSAFEKLVGQGDGFLLESVEGGERWARWSFVGWDPAFTLVASEGSSTIEGIAIDLPPGDPLQVFQALVERFRGPDAEEAGLGVDAPPLHGGAVGYLAYDAVRYIERLPNRPADDRGLPEMVWHFTGSLAAIDRLRDAVILIENVFIGRDPGAQYEAAVERLVAGAQRLGEARPYAVVERPRTSPVPEAKANLERREFEAAVRRAIEHIAAGDAFQIVPSLRFEVGFDGDAFAVYRSLRLVNPSPFMFFVRYGDITLAGSSPELMSRVRDGRVFSRPIAGTRPRGTSPESDAAFEEELLADPKERAEHVMLVDLSRNDIGRVCEFGSVTVDELMVIERYSHVMHIVSGVSGLLRGDLGPIDVLRATFPHGTVSGAPKVRAMEIIDDLEPTARGPYAGAVGYVDFSGNLDTAIGLRTMIARGTTAWVQAGAGIVVDSDPAAEYEECLNKAKAVLTAISAAGGIA